MSDTTTTLIVGSGLSGLTAARVLTDAGQRVQLLDKGSGVGGRLATRWTAGGLRFDHGAQYFTARDPVFRAAVDEWVAAGVVTEWCDNFPSPGRDTPKPPEPRYRGTGGMRGIADYLAATLPVRQNTRVTSLKPSGPRWAVWPVPGAGWVGDALLLTCPVPQSLALLADSGLTLDADLAADLGRVEYAPCLALMVTLDGPGRVPPPGGVFAEPPLAWVADNTRKGVSHPGDTAVTLHADADFSREHYATAEAEVTRLMLAAARPYLGDAGVSATALHRWKYSMPTVTYPARYAEWAGSPAGRLLFAGDAFGGPRVEGAYLSGLSAGRALLHGTGTT